MRHLSRHFCRAYANRWHELEDWTQEAHLANKAKLVTRGLEDFRKVPGLQVENWAG